MIEQVKGTSIAPVLALDLHKLLLDDAKYYAIRSAAADVLLEIRRNADWSAIVRELRPLLVYKR